MAFANPHLPWPVRLGYRSVLILVSGWLLLTALLPAPVQAQATWLQSKAHGDIAYFLFAAPARLERYDLAAASWLSPIALSATPTAFAVDSDGLYVAFDRSVSRLPLAGGVATHLENTATTISDLFTVNDILYLNHSAYPNGNLTSVNKVTGLTIDSKAYLYKVFKGVSVGQTIGKAFARDFGVSPADIVQVTLDADGALGAAGDSPYHAAYPDATQTFIFPDESRVVDSAGIVYNTADLSYNSSLAGAVDDLAFAGEVTVVLRTGALVAYNQQLLETGSYRPPMLSQPQKIYIAGNNIIAFAAGTSRGVQAATIALALLTPTPPEVVDPVGLLYRPDTVLLGNDGILYLFNQQYPSIFRWSLAARAYLPSIALSQSPIHLAYSAATNRLYLAYLAGKLTQFQLDEGVTEQPFANSPQTPCGLATAGEYLFVCDPSGAWESHFTYHPDGALISQKELNYFSKAYVWSAANRKLYFFRDNTSPNDLFWEEIDSEGRIGAKQDSPYHSSEGILHPIRVSPDGAVVLLGSGRLYDANSLTQVDTLANNITDAAWHNGRLYTTRQFTEQSQVQKWGTTYGLEKGVDLTSSATSLFAVEEGLLAVTDYQGMPRFVLLDSELNVLYQSPTMFELQAINNSPTPRGESVLFHSNLKSSVGAVTYNWDFGDGTQGIGQTTWHEYVSAGIYTATASAHHESETITATTTVTITGASNDDKPIIGLTITTNSPTALGSATKFTATVQSGTNVHYQWEFGDGVGGSGPVQTHFYRNWAGPYPITLTATNGAGSVKAYGVVDVIDGEVPCSPIARVTLVPAPTNLPYTGNVQRFTMLVDPPAAVNESIYYELLLNDEPIEPMLPIIDYTFTETGTYTISVVAYSACTVDSVRGSAKVTIVPRPLDQPDLSASAKIVTLANVEAGDILTYTIYLRNQQAVTAQAHLTETLPVYTTYRPESARATAGEVTVANQMLTWAGDVISGTPVILTYAVQVETAPVDTVLDSVGWLTDQLGNLVKLKAISVYNPGYRLSINNGALYTNQPQVTLRYSWDTNHDIQFVKFSNDGGFGEAAGTTDWLPVNAQNPVYANWSLATQNNTLLPRTVYALFRTGNGSQVGPFQDDIILDTLPPNLLAVTWLTVAQRSDQAETAEAQIRVTASDENSGITAVEFSNQPDFGMATAYPMSGITLDLTLTPPQTGLLYVRARDRAGNHSTVQTLSSGNSVQIFLPVVTR